jgi:hypothetical protein
VLLLGIYNISQTNAVKKKCGLNIQNKRRRMHCKYELFKERRPRDEAASTDVALNQGGRRARKAR